jgi:hypothetical protein
MDNAAENQNMKMWVDTSMMLGSLPIDYGG